MGPFLACALLSSSSRRERYVSVFLTMAHDPFLFFFPHKMCCVPYGVNLK